MLGRRAVEPAGDGRDDRIKFGLRRSIATVWRHLTRGQPADNLLPGFGISPDFAGVEIVEGEPGRPGALVMAFEAIPLNELIDRGVRRGNPRSRRRLISRPGTTGTRGSDDDQDNQRQAAGPRSPTSHEAKLRSRGTYKGPGIEESDSNRSGEAPASSTRRSAHV